MERLQRYDLLEPIAAGGMGEVFRGRATGEHGFEKTVAIKRILPELARDPEFVGRFVAEAKLTVALSHANIVQVLDLGRVDDSLFLVMELVHGVDLSSLMARLGERQQRTPIEIAVHLGCEALKGLAFAHDRLDAEGQAAGVVHCDISPANLLISYAGELKITDFGVAQALDLPRRQRIERVMGKYRYMPPEQLRGEAVDSRADLYSLAVVLHELVTLQPLFPRGDVDEVVAAVLRGTTAHTAAARPDVPPALDALMAQALAVDRRRRPASARAMLAELTQIARELPAVTTPDVGAWVRQLAPPAPAERPRGFDGALRQLLGGRANGTQTLSAAPTSLSFVARAGDDGATHWERARPARVGSRRVALLLVAAILVGLGGGTLVRRRLAAARRAVASSLSTAPPPSTTAPLPSTTAPLPSTTTPLPSTTTPLPPAPEPTPSTLESPPSVVIAPLERAPAPARAHARAPVARGGFLNVYAEPWATVVVDGRAAGTTPLMRLPLAAGTHRVRLENPHARARNLQVTVAAGETRLINVDLEPLP